MTFGFGIEQKNHILFIGWPPDWSANAYYIFDGWADPKQAKVFFGSVECLMQEAYAGTAQSNLTNKVFFYVYTPDYIKNIGTPIGSTLKVEYKKGDGKPEQIDNFFKESGLIFHRADPFSKPFKTLWQVIKERLGKKPSK